MKLKPGVRILGLRPELIVAMIAAQQIFAPDEFIITSGIDGTHSHGSLHYAGCAFDCRTRHLTQDRARQVTEELKAALGGDFDVVLESTHLHLEFQPKRPLT